MQQQQDQWLWPAGRDEVVKNLEGRVREAERRVSAGSYSLAICIMYVIMSYTCTHVQLKGRLHEAAMEIERRVTEGAIAIASYDVSLTQDICIHTVEERANRRLHEAAMETEIM